MRCAFIFHGSNGSSRENWIPWLKSRLGEKGFIVVAPDFPTPGGQSLESWLTAFGRLLPELGKGTVLIGHSVGAAFALRVLERANARVDATYLVGGFCSPLGNRFDALTKSFVGPPFDWAKIRQNSAIFRVFYSDNDSNVPLLRLEELPQKLGVPPFIVKGAGHFNSAAGYSEFPILLSKILADLG